MRVVAYPKSAHTNPCNDLLYSNVEKLGVEVINFKLKAPPVEADVLHVHWAENFTARKSKFAVRRKLAQWIKALNAYKKQGTKIIWSAHNLYQHDRFHRDAEEKFWDFLIPNLDGCVCFSEDSWEHVKSIRPQITCPHVIVPHGHYRDCYPITTTREQSRKHLGICDESFTYVIAGRIKAYKNVPGLIDAFRGVKSNAQLIIAGKVFDDDLGRQIAKAAANDNRISVMIGEISDEMLQTYMLAADLAVMPFTRILNSGSALMALSFNTPVLVPAIGSMPELKRTISNDWVRTFEGTLSPDILQDAASWVQNTTRTDRAPLDHLEWDSIAKQTVDFYKKVINK